MTKTFPQFSVTSLSLLLAILVATSALADGTTELVNVTLGAFPASEGVYRSRTETADIGSPFSGLPYSNTPTAYTSETRFTARQRQLSLLVQRDVNPDTHIAMGDEIDFLGSARIANSNESNSYNLPIRNMYATIGWDTLGLQVLVGQNWSLLSLNRHGITPHSETATSTIDAQYAAGFRVTQPASTPTFTESRGTETSHVKRSTIAAAISLSSRLRSKEPEPQVLQPPPKPL